MGKDINIKPTGGTINFTGNTSSSTAIVINGGDVVFSGVSTNNEFRIDTGIRSTVKFNPSVSVLKSDDTELIDAVGNWKGFPFNIKGEIGPTGPVGPTGDKGPKGIKGVKGDKGLKGVKGAESTDKGLTGDKGLKGLKGRKGIKASQGPIGGDGPKGLIGAKGLVGPAGPTAEKGELGPVGPKGPKGFKGPKGVLGTSIKGPKGANADKGPQGPTGTNKGDQGPKGTVGDKGPKGLQGRTAYLNVYVFYDATSMPEDDAKAASQSIRDWASVYQTTGEINKLYEGVIGDNSNNGENWLWWASYPYLGSLSGGTLSDGTQLSEFNSAVPNNTYHANWCKSNVGGNCVPKNVKFNDGTTVYRRINRGTNLDTGAAESISEGVPFDHSNLNSTATSGQGSFSGDDTNYLVIIVADESDGLVGMYHGQLGGTNTNATKSDLFNKPFELNGNNWTGSAGDEYTNRFLHDYCAFVQVYEDIRSSRGGNLQGLVYPVVNPLRGTSTYAFVQHVVGAVEGETITENEFLNKYGEDMTSVGPEDLNLSALTRTNVYSGLTSETCYTDLDASFKNGSGLKHFGFDVDPTVTGFTQASVSPALTSFLKLQGPTGDKGFKGTPGTEKGQKGNKGIKGLKGDKGLVGDNEVGPTGPKGPIGGQGPQGPAGDEKGPKGEVGVVGPKGLRGPDGGIGASPKGAVGPGGDQGNEGDIGPTSTDKGIKGTKGERGTKGPKGIKGIKGNITFQGPIGPIGPQSDKGIVGDKGDKGLKGHKGLKGLKGVKGPRGPISDQGDGGPNSDAGEVADKGIKGIKGLKGPKGPKGITGGQGPIGPTSNATLITSNRVLHLDATEPSSYPGNGTTWYDLSPSNNDATLVGGVSFNDANYMDFNGAEGSYVSLGSTSTMSRTAGTIFIQFNKDIANTVLLWGSDYTNMIEARSGSFYSEATSNCNYFSSPAVTMNIGQWYVYAVVFDNSKAYHYMDGNYIGETPSYGSDNCSTAVSSLVSDFQWSRIGESTAYNPMFDGQMRRVIQYSTAFYCSTG